MVAGDLTHQREAEPHTTVAALALGGGAIEGLEDALALGLGEAGTSILHHQQGAPWSAGQRTNTCFGGRSAAVATRVLEQVPNQPSQHPRIPLDVDRLAADLHLEPGGLLRDQSEELELLAGPHLSERIDATGQEQLPDQLVQLRDVRRRPLSQLGSRLTQ